MRATDGPATPWKRFAIFWNRIGSTLIVAAAIGIAAYAVHVASDANENAKAASKAATQAVAVAQAQVARLVRETAERRDQTCRIQERKQLNDVEALRQTYDFLARAAERGTLDDPLNQAILTALPRAVREAQEDDAPAFCHKPGVGLPDRPTKLPTPPKSIPVAPGR